jgi:hypothetical protein
LNYKDIPAFCINLDRRPDRWIKAKKEFEKVGWSIERWPAKQYEKSPYPNMPIGAAGCLDSHKSIWRECRKNKIEMVAVFEDDLVFPSDFAEVFPKAFSELPDDWRLWHLHSSGIRQSQSYVPLGKYLTRLTTHGWGTHGYIMKGSCIDYIEGFRPKKPQKVDTILTLGLISIGVQPYGTRNENALCFQRGEDTDIKETSQTRYWREQLKNYGR